jgi:hypothetical protein
LWLASALAGCGGRSSSTTNGGGTPSSTTPDGMPDEPPCGAAKALCDVDQCDADGCAFIAIAGLPPDVGGILADEDAVYVLADSSKTIYRVPKCGGQPNVVARTTTGIGPFAAFGGSVFWVMRDAAGGGASLYRTPADGNAPSVQVDLTEADASASAISALVADESALFLFEYQMPGIVRLDATGARALFTAAAGNIVTQDDGALYFQAGDSGQIVAVSKLDGSSNTLLAANAGRLAGANSKGLYFEAYVNEAMRSWRRLERIPATGGDPMQVRDLTSTELGTVDEHCGYFVNQTSASSVAFRFPLGGGSAEVLHAAVGMNVALSSDTVYVVDGAGGLFRRPK